ncbi:transcription antitermination factor NusB [Tessaracoccus sp. OH4464_COT-324]|uniref:transcription antitermination factor NusB n=1 Tax=Tessaracoccus sp. OH4464_COT-324 TaxID=2491059 RepID=UPI0018F5B5B1|nr:transcription antitermination factor NusB [Tessaracoccus sp. OH4464_COT-324]
MDVDPKFSTQTKARKAALDLLFQADMRGLSIIKVLDEQRALAETPIRPFTIELVQGVAQHLQQIDRRINDCAAGNWTVARMPRVDRNLARIAMYEIDHSETPDAVAIAQAIELATWLSTNESPAFLNGLLGQAARSKTAN